MNYNREKNFPKQSFIEVGELEFDTGSLAQGSVLLTVTPHATQDFGGQVVPCVQHSLVHLCSRKPLVEM